eukprot:CAMPEP_0198335544 /NCGR_PEP_ID=MMETSP1450-20131203/20390_1 /TAXON_ID=753684 ORGANISM="Madagascaria erythrocladiodes, Strain CCMP3234" /NCGR_SAMPLE_ID=MMETSP1450 /ASSEMBLY_ACC=CAM_ASM_001115 /LENGTH=51 /DNA_ID=CAMNT_0044040217 /DNA_START=44 /DNA_END=196 /DNA_ORIENTATION=-
MATDYVTRDVAGAWQLRDDAVAGVQRAVPMRESVHAFEQPLLLTCRVRFVW